MSGWRAWIGRVEPAFCWAEGHEWARLLPDGVELMVSCLGVQTLSDADLERAHNSILDHVRRLADDGLVSGINVGGSPVVGFQGYKGHQRLISELRGITNLPIVTSLTAEIEALRTLGLKKIAVATPYPEKRNAERKNILEEAGFQVMAIEGLGIERLSDIFKLPPHTVYRVAVEAYRKAPEADGVYIACPAWPAAIDIDPLEKDLGKPVVANVQAQVWASLRTIGIKTPIVGYGTLLQEY